MNDATQKLVEEKTWHEMTDAEFVTDVRSWPRVSEWDEPGLVDDVLAEIVRRLEAAQRPPVSPEVREEMFRLLYDASGSQFMRSNERHSMVTEQRDAILARFSVPSQPVYDEEKIARLVEQQMRGAGLSDNPAEFDSSIHSWGCEHPDRYGPCGCFQEMRNGLVAALVAALRNGELTREGTKRG